MRMVLNMSDVNRKRITIVCMILLQRAGQKPGNNIFDYFLHQPGADGLGIAKIASRIVVSSLIQYVPTSVVPTSINSTKTVHTITQYNQDSNKAIQRLVTIGFIPNREECSNMSTIN
jgi:hypothetical protein